MTTPYVGTRPVVVYTYRGLVERGNGRGYSWRDGYSTTGANGAVSYPWMTYRECQADARSRGAVARFWRALAPNTPVSP